MKFAGILPVVIAITMAVAADHAAAEEAAKQNDVLHLMKISEVVPIADQTAMASLRTVIERERDGTPDRVSKVVEEEVFDFMQDTVQKEVAEAALLLDKVFSHEEIKQLIAFYETDVGRKLVHVWPSIYEQIAVASRQRFEQENTPLRQRILDRLQAEGLK